MWESYVLGGMAVCMLWIAGAIILRWFREDLPEKPHPYDEHPLLEEYEDDE